MKNKLIEKAKKVLLGNKKKGYTLPTNNKLYPAQWKWDSGFISLGYSYFNLKYSIAVANGSLALDAAVNVLNLKSQLAIDEAGISVIIFASIFALSLPTAIVQKVLIGLQKGWQANNWIIYESIFDKWFYKPNNLNFPESRNRLKDMFIK